MSLLTYLKGAESRSNFSEIIGFKPKSLSYILYKIPPEKKYHSFEILKKNGGTRLIQAPIPELKNLQRRVATLLYNCCYEIERSELEESKKHNIKKRKILSHGFKKKCSIYTNAKIHTHKRYILNFDIKDFFPSINFGRVRGYFIKNNVFELNEEVATVIAQIACHENQLPQGSPCSPIISNLIAHLLDVRLVQLAKKYKLNYSRYADDITFSTNQKKFPEEIAFQHPEDPKTWDISGVIKDQVLRSGFVINHNKTRMRYRDFRQVVTGLVVNKKVNVRSEYYKLARSMAHHLFTKGSYNIPSKISPVDIPNKKPEPNNETEPNRLEGILNHIYYVRDLSDTRKLKTKQNEPTSIWKLFKQILFFKNFIASDKSVVICEGPTDSIYIKLALKKNFEKYPSLIKKENKFSYYIRFLDGTKKNTVRVLELGGGTSNLNKFLGKYQENFKNYPAWEKPKNPVILLVDNDTGAETIFNTIKTKYKVEIKKESNDDFFHIDKNLYLIKTPNREDKTETCIEDLFDEQWLKQIKHNGKTFFKDETKFDKSKHYGKTILATKVIPQNFSSVNFAGFEPLLNRLVKAIENYKNK